jgi:hypothetical protein
MSTSVNHPDRPRHATSRNPTRRKSEKVPKTATMMASTVRPLRIDNTKVVANKATAIDLMAIARNT